MAKIVIELDDSILDIAKNNQRFYPVYLFEKIWKAIVKGVSLDDIKAEIENKMHNLIGIMYETGYSRGLKERKEEDQDYKDGLEDGRMEAWETAKKIILGADNGGLTDAEIKTIFNKTYVGVLVENTATEVITKIQEYEEKQKVPSVAGACSILEDICPYNIPCEECEVHCSVERAKQKLKGDKE